MKKKTLATPEPVAGQCGCGAVTIEIDFPARWAWHDHTQASRLAHGAAYATYVGSWRKRFRITAGEEEVTRYEDRASGATRGFCSQCGTPLFYERARSPHMVNVPRALFQNRTGREPLYHIGIQELRDWTYTGQPLVPLKGFPGVVWERPKRRKRMPEPMF
ncbi:GFA family protein [Reyranella sp. CPCC 100927]|uniref:GFA family protein n=1 Tax=Reyranella sp. CPCC 100927 TaxID=2599616 RepID=UPI0011B71F6A|nr:GFA family protein [Reyranella sp. CPCC 100927]TWS98480.1 GFA family protein [Reyranella sp. CPCC 100927]